MEKSYSRHYGSLIILVIVINAAMVWGQSNDNAIADKPSWEETVAGINEMSGGCSTFMSSEYLYGNDVKKDQWPSINGVMVAENMRCRQCRGKCKAEDLRCRSQCVSESPCLVDCDERWSKCETMCKQVFQCE